eukprot:symbB.v1.2.012696.t1/scaffold812.1/size160323/4
MAEKRFTPEELEKARQEVDAMLEQDDNFAGYSVAGPLTIHGVDEAAPAPVSQATPATSSRPSKRKAEKVEGKDESEENPWLAENPWESAGSSEVPKPTEPLAERPKAAPPEPTESEASPAARTAPEAWKRTAPDVPATSAGDALPSRTAEKASAAEDSTANLAVKRVPAVPPKAVWEFSVKDGFKAFDKDSQDLVETLHQAFLAGGERLGHIPMGKQTILVDFVEMKQRMEGGMRERTVRRRLVPS